ncbi:hypothetical protein QO034_03085 [Sedimentitalea sp. JM2-8]|uniref:Uncharacterized protein n=1 Tax=Sedimentitalea xiamensis TaxID=3050037 RepID=A0ABT7FAE3_9RHOB|nr:hypothetical protein [Sedimentitalea xiamensis]MDK3072083.1 hypothetical protein [Sedimentitalea xiamensis]
MSDPRTLSDHDRQNGDYAARAEKEALRDPMIARFIKASHPGGRVPGLGCGPVEHWTGKAANLAGHPQSWIAIQAHA